MKPPNVSPPPAQVDQLSVVPARTPTPKQQHTHPTTPTNTANLTSQPATNVSDATTKSQASTTNNSSTVTSSITLITNQPAIITKPTVHVPVSANPDRVATSIPTTAINSSQEQQAPLALTTQNQSRASIQVMSTTAAQIQVQQLSSHTQQTTQNQIVSITSSSSTTTTQSLINSQIDQGQSKILPNQLNTSLPTNTPIALAAAPTGTGPTALVIIPQHSTATSVTSAKPGTITTKTTQIPTTYATTAAHIALASTTQPSTIQMQAPVATIVPALTQVPMTAHQNTALVNRPPQTLPVVPITTPTNTGIKHEQNRNTCCLFDNGIRCDRVAGNASFSARIQKIVGTKKMNFALDRTARHHYICDHHKAIITVAKKMNTPARETKASARNYTGNNNANTLSTQHTNSYNDLALNQSMQHQMNLEMLSNQSRLANSHSAVLNSMPVRPGNQVAYGHYSGPHPNSAGQIENLMAGGFDSTGGDDAPSSSGGVDVDLQQLQVNTLRRYKRHFRVQTRPGLNKMQLAESLKHHFRTLPIIEKEAITYFVYIVKCSRNKLDHNPKAD